MDFNPPVNSLRELVKDSDDFALGALSAIPDLKEVKPIGLKPLTIKDQIRDLNDDFCSGYAVAGSLEIMEGVELYAPFSFAASKVISGGVEKWGQDLRSAMDAPRKYGIPEVQDLNDAVRALNPSERRQFSNYAPLYQKARFHSQKTYFKTSGPYDPVDNVRAWIFKNKRPAVLGVKFGWQLTDYELNGTPDGYGHAMYAIDTTEDGRLVIVNSAGLEAGREGVHILSRETANEYIMKYGCYQHMDVSLEEARAAMDLYRSSNMPWWKKIIIRLFT